MHARVVKQVLSDGSDAWNVEFRAALMNAPAMTFACESAAHAAELRAALNRCAWVDVDAGEFAAEIEIATNEVAA